MENIFFYNAIAVGCVISANVLYDTYPLVGIVFIVFAISIAVFYCVPILISTIVDIFLK